MTSWLDTASLLDLNVYGSGRQGFDEKSHRLHESYHEPVIDREHIRHFGYTHSRTQRRAWATPEKFKVQHDEKRVQGIPLDSLALRNNSIETAASYDEMAYSAARFSGNARCRSFKKQNKEPAFHQNAIRYAALERTCSNRVPARMWGAALRREVIGAWLTGEVHVGYAAADFGVDVRGGVSVIDVIANKDGGLEAIHVAVDRLRARRIVTVKDFWLKSTESLMVSAMAAWPEGIIIHGTYDDFFLSAHLVESKLPALVVTKTAQGLSHRDLPVSVWANVFSFIDKLQPGASACVAAARASESICAQSMQSFAASHFVSDISCIKRNTRAVSLYTPSKEILGEGAFKKVYKVGDEAVAVMNITVLYNDVCAANEVTRELAILCHLTKLVARRICPNFVTIIGSFVQCYPSGSLHSLEKTGRSPDTRLCVRMGLCSCGDIESWLRRQPGMVLPTCTTLRFFFQMCFALYASRATLGLRHYDLKLLNFLVAPVETNIYARYHLADAKFDVQLYQEAVDAWIKLTDFGTSHMEKGSLGKPAKGAIFTTIENVPIDLLLSGDIQCTHTYAHDTFSLGLATLHLFGGGVPYEELMHYCTCPDDLRVDLAAVWLESREVSSFNILANLASDHDTDPKLTRYTLFDTFYRFLVLLGVPTSNHDSISKLGPTANRVLDIVRTHLIGSSNKPEHPEISSGELKDVLFRNYIKSRQLFAKHTATFNLKQGVHPAMARCRKQLGSNIDILTAMLDFDPRRRPTMRSLLMSPMFDSLRGGASKSAAGDSLHLFDAFKRDIFERPLPDV